MKSKHNVHTIPRPTHYMMPNERKDAAERRLRVFRRLKRHERFFMTRTFRVLLLYMTLGVGIAWALLTFDIL